MTFHEINDLIVRDGKLTLSHLPYSDGQRVRVLVFESEPGSGEGPRLPIATVRELLRGSVSSSCELTEPMIPDDSWGMLR